VISSFYPFWIILINHWKLNKPLDWIQAYHFFQHISNNDKGIFFMDQLKKTQSIQEKHILVVFPLLFLSLSTWLEKICYRLVLLEYFLQINSSNFALKPSSPFDLKGIILKEEQNTNTLHSPRFWRTTGSLS
jgi:hypothetical protein